MKTSRILLAGLGSPHGDDQAGWLMVEQLAEAFSGEDCVECRKVSNPIDLFDWIEPFDAVHIVDCGVADFAEHSDEAYCDVPAVWLFSWDGSELVCEVSEVKGQTEAVSLSQDSRTVSRKALAAGESPKEPAASALPLTKAEFFRQIPRSATIITSVLQSLTSRGSHDFALTEVLALGSQLQRLPGNITVWVIVGEQFEHAGEPSLSVKQNVQRAAPQIQTFIREQLACKSPEKNADHPEESCR